MAHDPYDAECIAGDLARYSEDIFHADINEPYESPNRDGCYVILMETPAGRRFEVTVTELAEADPPTTLELST